MRRPRALGLLAAALGVAAALGAAGCKTRGPDEQVHRRQESQRRVMTRGDADVRPTLAQLAAEDARRRGEGFVFTSFRDGGEYGLHLATSRDGLIWRNLTEQPIFVPRVGGEGGPWGMRDPNIARGPDGVYHMVWTWTGGAGAQGAIGYARSTDLLNWTDIRSLEVTPTDWKVDACWAPELFYDRERGQWLIVWSSAVQGRFPETAEQAEANHRMYATTTQDFRTFERASLFFNPGFPVIDPAFMERDGVITMFFKDERQWGPEGEKKQIRFVQSRSPYGPWGEPSVAITRRWVEGPSIEVIAGWVVVYFDEYTRGRYGAVASRDLEAWDDVTALVRFPEGHRHGSVLRVPIGVVEALEAGAARR